MFYNLINQGVNGSYYWNCKKKHIKHILGMVNLNKENYNNNDFYFYLTKEWPDIYTLNQS